jgi:hypothetical protein
MKRALVTWGLGCLVPTLALAVSTQRFELETHETFEKGKLEGTIAWDSGKLTRGIQTERIAIEAASVAYAAARGPDGALYVGTGHDGVIQRVAQKGASVFAETGAAVVTSLVFAGDTLYAGTLPGGKIFAVDQKGSVKELVKLEGAEHVWGLAYDAKRRLLHAATGPEGKLFAVDERGTAKLEHDDVAEHLLCAAVDPEGRVYAGTSHGARLVRVGVDGARVLYDFEGQELTALSFAAGLIAVAANEFPDPPPIASDPSKSNPGRLKRPKPGKGKLFVMHPDGRVDELYASSDAHISAVEIDRGGDAVLTGLSENGRILRVGLDGSRATVSDVDERQIISLGLSSTSPFFVSSDGVAVYEVVPKAEVGTWTSAVLDAKAPARWGELDFRARGKVRVQARSGDTETPDDGWSAWSAALEQRGPIRSPGGRFLQLRASLVSDDAELYALHAYYLPHNRPARVRNVRVKPAKANDAKDSSSKAKAPRTTVVSLTWDVDNPDEDRLRFRLFYRRDEQASFLPMLREHDELDQAEYSWDTQAIPDGYYRVRVEASDEYDNPVPYARSMHATSGPLLVDNHAPVISELAFSQGKLTGRVIDSVGPVSRLEVSLDGGPHKPFYPLDDLLDTADERFAVEVGELAAGTHIASVRATDAAHNVGSRAIEFVIRR